MALCILRSFEDVAGWTSLFCARLSKMWLHLALCMLPPLSKMWLDCQPGSVHASACLEDVTAH
eukprot:6635598-Prorocentrum_lima.AAC.1